MPFRATMALGSASSKWNLFFKTQYVHQWLPGRWGKYSKDVKHDSKCFLIRYMVCRRLFFFNWYGPSILRAMVSETLIFCVCVLNIKSVFSKQQHCASTEDRLPPANHPLQRSPTWASAVRTGDEIFGTPRLLWASEAEVAVAVGDDWAVGGFLGWR